MSVAQTRVYRNGVLEVEGFAIAAVSEYLAQDDTVVWVDFCEPSMEQLHELADELGLHELAVEDALSEHQRPKLDHYESHLFLSAHAVRVDTENNRLLETEIDAFINARWMITVRKNETFSMAPVLQRWDRSRDLAKHGVSFLLYGLLDVVVDGYFDAVQCFDEYYDEVSEGIFSERPLDPAQQRHWFQMRQALVRFHRLAVPMREAVSGLMRREHDAVAESLKKVTSWAAIVAVPTLITGYYGMNVPYPGFDKQWGVTLSAVLIVVMSSALYFVFRRRDWL